MANFSVLKKEVSTDPLGRGYSSMTNQQIVDSLNTPNRTVIQSKFVTARTMMNEMDPTTAAAILDALDAAKSSNSVVKWTMGFLTGDLGIDVGAPNTQSTVDQLVTAGVLTSAQGDDLKNMANATVSRGTEIGFGVVSLSDIVRIS